jgi:hypothetical protein
MRIDGPNRAKESCKSGIDLVTLLTEKVHDGLQCVDQQRWSSCVYQKLATLKLTSPLDLEFWVSDGPLGF